MNRLVLWGWTFIGIGSALLLWSWYRRADLEDDDEPGEWRLVESPDEWDARLGHELRAVADVEDDDGTLGRIARRFVRATDPETES